MSSPFEKGVIVQIKKPIQRGNKTYADQFGYIRKVKSNSKYTIIVKILYKIVDESSKRFKFALVDKKVSVSEEEITLPDEELFSEFRTEATVWTAKNKTDLYELFSEPSKGIQADINFKPRWKQVMSRSGDTRAIISKSLARSLTANQQLSPEILFRVRQLRGDLRKTRQKSRNQSWKENGVTCLYCGGPATDIDHYISAVQKGDQIIGRFLETGINLVPSCPTCHRAGKDDKRYRNRETGGQRILEWWDNVNEHGANHPMKTIERRLKKQFRGQNNIKQKIQEAKARIRLKLENFHTFHTKYAPAMPKSDHRKLAKKINRVLKNTYKLLLSQLTTIDIADPLYRNSVRLVDETNEKFAFDNQGPESDNSDIVTDSDEEPKEELTFEDFNDSSLEDKDPEDWAFEDEEGQAEVFPSLEILAALQHQMKPIHNTDLKF